MFLGTLNGNWHPCNIIIDALREKTLSCRKTLYRHSFFQATSCKFMVNSTFLCPHFSCLSYLYNFWWHLIVNNNKIIYCVKKLLKLFSSFFLLLLFFYSVFGATHKITWKCNYFFIRVILFVKYCLPYILRSLK